MNAVSPSIDKLFQKTKGQLFFKKRAGFLGPLLGKLNFQWTLDLPTAAISATTLYWNPNFFESIDPDTRVTVLAHELQHNGRLHGARMGNRCPEIWNIAGDHVINLDLKAHGFYMDGFPYLMDDKYIGWSTEDIYDDLMNSGKPMPGPGEVPGLGADIIKADAKDIPKMIASAVAAASIARMGKKAGDIPGETTLIIDEFLNPKLPWEVLLANFFNELTTEEYSFQRPNRRYEDPLLPGKMGRNGLEHLIYYLDISGSIEDSHILRFNSEVKSVKERFEPEKLTLVTFDTEIQDEYVFEKDDPFEKIVVTGRGGTDLRDVYAHAQKHRPTAIIIFTDLHVRIPPNPGVPIIWICVDNPKATVPYGRLIHIDE